VNVCNRPSLLLPACSTCHPQLTMLPSCLFVACLYCLQCS
jgi:hypothetical protein